jgi:glycosyltransferase involved in cell wall biosynthesis
VVCSHEPASTLRLGAKLRSRVAWVADLGDPVLASYTPWRWRRRAQALEREVWRTAHGVTVTTQAAASLLAARHGELLGQCCVIPQGYEDSRQSPPPWAEDFFDQSVLEVVYTGSFYGFRNPSAVAEGVLRTPGVRLTIASMTAPSQLIALARQHPDRIRLLGFLPHTQALQLQSAADIVLNIANQDSVQIPGKLFEYFGSGRPILHVGAADDQAARLLTDAGAGWVCENSPALISHKLASLLTDKRSGRLGNELIRDDAVLAKYRWERLALDYQSFLERALHNFHSGRSDPSVVPQPQAFIQ